MDRKFRTIILALLCMGMIAGCSGTPMKMSGYQAEFPKPVEAVRKAGIDALVVNGFEITKTEPFYVEGYRPRTWGFLCTPGGETSGIWLEQEGPSKTAAWINTAMSSFG